MAGLLTRGSVLSQPSRISPVARLASLTAYSCGGSHGIGACWLHRTVFPFNPGAFRSPETISAHTEFYRPQLQEFSKTDLRRCW